MADDWRYAVAIEPITLSDDDTDNIDLPSEGIISKMEIEISNTNAAAIEDVGQRRLAEHITNVSLMGDTNDIIHDLNGFQSRYFAMDTEGKIPPEEFRGYNDAVQNTTIPIYFGRSARDKDFGLDLSKWTNVKLSITNDFEATRFVADGGQLSARFLWTFDPEITPAGYLAKTLVDEGAVKTANMWTRPVILPTRYPIRRIGVEGYIPTLTTASHEGEPKATLATSIENIKFTKQARKDMIWQDSLAQLMRFNADEYGHELIERYIDHGSATPLWTDTMLAALEAIVATPTQDSCTITGHTHTENTAASYVQNATTVAAATFDALISSLDQERNHALANWSVATADSIMASGRGYNSTGLFRAYTMMPHEIHGDYPDNWLHPGAAGDGVCELMYQLGSTDVKARTLIEQAVPHPIA